MNIVNITLGVDTQPCSSITLGRRGENEVTQVVVDFSSWVEEFGAGVITLLAMRSQDTSAYPVVLSLDGNTATWDVTSTDTAYKGSGRAEYIYTVGEQIAKSVVFNTVVMQDIGEPSETPPDPYEDWLERLTELGAETQANAEAAQQSAENAAESAEDAAQSATSAEGYAGQAETAAGLAQAAQTVSEAARDAAQTAQASAESSATAASGSAASAAGSATAAAGSASDASASASAAGASATAAGASATTASTAAGQAEAAKTAAQAAQSAAEDAAEDAQQAAQQAHVEYEQLSDAVDDLSDEVSQQKSAIDDLTALTNRKAGMLVDSASGAIASFAPDATIDNLLGVSVAVEPVQDLHGYDHPWPAGGGKNKLSYPYAFTTKTVNGCTITVDQNGILMFSGTATDAILAYIKDRGATAGNARLFLEEGSYIVNGCPPGGSGSTYRVTVINSSGSGVASDQGTGATFTVPSGGGYYGIQIFIASGYDTNSLVIKPMIRLATETDATFAPYENICPISGWDSVEVETAGVNLWDKSNAQIGYIDNANGEAVLSTAYRNTGRIKVTPNTQYYILTEQTNGMWAAWYDKYGSFISGFVSYGTFPLVTSPANAGFVALTVSSSSSGNIDTFAFNYPSTYHDYHPYAGNHYTVQLGETVYGGTLDVTNGTLTVDMAMVDLGTLSWARINDKYFRAFRVLNNGKVVPNGVVANLICSQYTAVSGYSIAMDIAPDKSVGTEDSTPPSVRIKDTDYTDAATFKTAMSGVQLCYELATPITIQLDPVAISTIAGQQNNVWADAGDVSVEFAADVKTYIDNKIAAAVAALS